MGGGSDYWEWYSQHGGAVLTCAIKHYCYISARWRPPFFEQKSRVVWSKIELFNDRYEVQHPAVRAVLEYLQIDRGLEIHHFTDLPARTGLGSSSAFTVGLLSALHELNGETYGSSQLAKEAIHVEQKVMNETVGIQDQIQVAHGGLNYIRISQDGQYSIRPINLSGDKLREFESHVMLFYTGIVRTASRVACAQVENTKNGALNEELASLSGMARRGADILCGEGELEEFGLMLHEAWMLKRRLSSQITNATIDQMYSSAQSAGAIGGKLLGAGGGGFLLIFAKPENHAAIRQGLGGSVEVPFAIDFSGVRVIYNG